MIKKFTTHLKAKLCIWGTGKFCDGMAETISSDQTMMEAMFEQTIKALIMPWSSKTNMDPLNKVSKLSNSREALERYTNSMYISKGWPSWLCFKLGHDKPLETYSKSELLYNQLAEQNLDLSIDMLKTKRTRCTGWFAGSIPNRMNSKDFEDALKQHLLLVRATINNLELLVQNYNASRFYYASHNSHNVLRWLLF
jgi:hypothetical protein